MLKSKRHYVSLLDDIPAGELADTDLILAPNAWHMRPELLKYVESALKAARAVKYPVKVKK